MKTRNLLAVTLSGLAFLLLSCGEGTIQFGGTDDDPPDTVVIEGDMLDINPQVAGADIVVFVYTDLEDPGTFADFEKQRSVRVPSDSDPMEFRLTQVKSGDLTVVFLQDHVSDPDGSIDTGDPYATLSDPDHLLRDARSGETIRISDVDIDFQRGTAEAESIRSVRQAE